MSAAIDKQAESQLIDDEAYAEYCINEISTFCSAKLLSNALRDGMSEQVIKDMLYNGFCEAANHNQGY